MKPEPATPAPPSPVPLDGPPPPAIDPKATEWQGNPWTCLVAEPEYVGAALAVTRPDKVEFNIIPADEQDEIIILGIKPRRPKQDEYKEEADRFPGLASSCWWVTEDFSVGGYNCFGHVIAREAVAKGDKIRTHEPTNELPIGSKDDPYDLFFKGFGYTLMSEPADNAPPAARIAWFTGPHVALRSDYRYQGEDLWESKLGTYQLRILHPLRAIEGQQYGTVARWYRIS